MKTFPEAYVAHYMLGAAFCNQGRFDEAIAEYQDALRLNPGLPQGGLRQAQRLAGLKARLPALLEGKERTRNAIERLALADLCQNSRKEPYAAARWYAEAFAAEPSLAGDVAAGDRYNAACAAALDETERGKLRRQALDWLKVDLEAWRRLLGEQSEKVNPKIGPKMLH